MKLFFIKHEDGAITCSTWPIKENGIESTMFEVSEEDKAAVDDGTKDWVFDNGVLTIAESTKKADREAAIAAIQAEEQAKAAELEILKTKLSEGKASLNEIQLTLSKLL